MTKSIKMMAIMFCVAALVSLSSCSKESEQIGTKWKCTYHEEFYGHYSENQYVGTEWDFSDKEEDKDRNIYFLYINGIQVATYHLDNHAEPNFYEIIELCNYEPTEYREIVELLIGSELSINGNTLEYKDFEGNPVITWSKL